MRDDVTQPKKLTLGLQVWIDARRRFHLSHAQVQMARELGMNPKKLGGMANHRQEPWEVPLPRYIEELYLKRFKKTRPDSVRPIEQITDQDTIPRPAGESVMKEFRPLNLETIRLERGRDLLTLRALTVVGQHVMDVRLVTLTRVNEAGDG